MALFNIGPFLHGCRAEVVGLERVTRQYVNAGRRTGVSIVLPDLLRSMHHPVFSAALFISQRMAAAMSL
ncbi:MAG: hypothetical protein JWR15_4366 [Prosthecobacter sp.]|nr:hypothetical protein [Prosthecobacter sp.]